VSEKERGERVIMRDKERGRVCVYVRDRGERGSEKERE
jgi:hypothetical protein